MITRQKSAILASQIIDAPPALPDVLNEIVPVDENISVFADDSEMMEFYLTCVHIMEEFIDAHPKDVAEPDFEEIFNEGVEELAKYAFAHHDGFVDNAAEEEIDDIIEFAKSDFYSRYIPPRSFENTFADLPNRRDCAKKHAQKIREQLTYLYNQPQHEQRTPAWYEFRYNLITASSAHKIFNSQATINQLIYEKCKHCLRRCSSSF